MDEFGGVHLVIRETYNTCSNDLGDCEFDSTVLYHLPREAGENWIKIQWKGSPWMGSCDLNNVNTETKPNTYTLISK